MKKAKVLYVEDEVFLAKIVSETLQGRGYDVVLESDGAKALDLFVKEKPDLCVLDIMLPNKDGFTIADEIRERDSQVPIIFFSAPRHRPAMWSTALNWARTIISASHLVLKN